LIHLALVAFNPVDIAKSGLACHGSNGDVAWVFAVGGGHAETDHLSGSTFKRLLNVHRCIQVEAIDGENAIARGNVQAGLSQWSFCRRIEFSTGVDFRQAIAVVV